MEKEKLEVEKRINKTKPKTLQKKKKNNNKTFE
jgi:hypothetical protein